MNLYGLQKAKELKDEMITKLNETLLGFENENLKTELKDILIKNIK